jgi:phosphopantothenoylcysteine decarboxylase/phosphopantothenate--cysteine ligase
VLAAPAMNVRMWTHAATVANVETLKKRGVTFVGPNDGAMACNEHGPGRMSEPEEIVAAIEGMLTAERPLTGKRAVVTSGPTREAIDPVRYISNRSSGKMGVAVAAAAARRGATVTLVAGPLSVAPPAGVNVVDVESTAQMAEAVRAHLGTADALVMAAAPADFRASDPSASKIKKAGRPKAIALDETVDILKTTLSARKAGAIIVGFALETDDVLAHAQEKLSAKQLDLIVVNDAREAGAGFGGDTNRVTILAPNAPPQVLPLLSKSDVADAILDRVEALLGGR